MRVIDADALKEKLKSTYRYFHIKTDIDEAPTIDAVPVVRCRDCVYYTHNFYGSLICLNEKGMIEPEEDDFCSYGKKETKNT